ncbi:MAG: TRAP transporter large permease [Geminicoccaceae bacterium]|nr:TRAP transporter large permease [Geminicoccaceae bacterium]
MALLMLGMPVVFALLLGPGVSLVVDGRPDAFFGMLQQRLFNGMNSFPLMAVPFFILAGEVMNRGNITVALVDFSRSLIGHVRGGLAQVNVLSSILFAGLSGSAVADTSALGSMLIPAMEKNGYSRRFAAAITAASSVIGPIIPPSGIMILYAFIMNVSVAGLFAAGIVPGLLVGLGLMAMVWWLAGRRGFPVASRKATWPERGTALRLAFWPLLTPIILLGGILTGVFTPTEAAAVAAGYALVVCLLVTRSLRVRELGEVFYQTALSAGTILLLVAAAVAFSSVISLFKTPQALTDMVLAVSDNPFALLFAVNILLFIVGMFLDAGPAILILGPILGPAMVGAGVDPMHFAIVMCVNVTVGLATPPMGLVLFVAAGISGEKVERIALSMLPFLLVEIAVIFLITFVPEVSMTLPRLLGFAAWPNCETDSLNLIACAFQ